MIKDLVAVVYALSPVLKTGGDTSLTVKRMTDCKEIVLNINLIIVIFLY